MSVNGYVTGKVQEATDQRHLESCFADQDVSGLERPRHHQERVRRRWMVGGDDFRAQWQVGLPVDNRTRQSAGIRICDSSSQFVSEFGCRWRFSHALLSSGIPPVGVLASLCCNVLVSTGSGLPDKMKRRGRVVRVTAGKTRVIASVWPSLSTAFCPPLRRKVPRRNSWLVTKALAIKGSQ